MTHREAVRLLIADDHQIVREGLRTILSRATDGVEVHVVGEAGDGDEAVLLAEKLAPDVVLMDLQMPGTDGVEATRRIRALARPCAVIILTTFDNDSRVRDAIRAGAIGYLLKDVARADLLRAIVAAARGEPALHPSAQQALMREVTTPAPASPFDGLTPRERDVLRLIARGASNKQIAATLYLSVGTVKGYVSALLPKLGVADRTQAALLAARHGLE